MGKKLLALLIIIGGSAVSLCAMGPSTSSSSSSSRKGKERVTGTQKEGQVKERFNTREGLFGDLAVLPNEVLWKVFSYLEDKKFDCYNFLDWRRLAFTGSEELYEKRIKYGGYVKYIEFPSVTCIEPITKNMIALGCSTGQIIIYDLEQDQRIASIKPRSSKVKKLMKLKGGALLAQFADQQVKIFELLNLNCIREFRGGWRGYKRIDDQNITIGNELVNWREPGVDTFKTESEEHLVYDIAIGGIGNRLSPMYTAKLKKVGPHRLAAQYSDRNIGIWDIKKREECFIIKADSTCFKVLNDNELAIGCFDGSVGIFNINKGTWSIKRSINESNTITETSRVEFIKNLGDNVLAIGNRKRIIVWNYKTDEVKFDFFANPKGRRRRSRLAPSHRFFENVKKLSKDIILIHTSIIHFYEKHQTDEFQISITNWRTGKTLQIFYPNSAILEKSPYPKIKRLNKYAICIANTIYRLRSVREIRKKEEDLKEAVQRGLFIEGDEVSRDRRKIRKQKERRRRLEEITYKIDLEEKIRIIRKKEQEYNERRKKKFDVFMNGIVEAAILCGCLMGWL